MGGGRGPAWWALLPLLLDCCGLAAAQGEAQAAGSDDLLVLWICIGAFGGLLLILAAVGVPLWFSRRARLRAKSGIAQAGVAGKKEVSEGFEKSITSTSLDEDTCVVVENIHRDQDEQSQDGVPASQIGSRFSVPDQETLATWMRGVYARYNPAKASRVGELLEKYRGREEELIEHIVAKYRLGPCAPRHHQGCAQSLDEAVSHMCGACSAEPLPRL